MSNKRVGVSRGKLNLSFFSSQEDVSLDSSSFVFFSWRITENKYLAKKGCEIRDVCSGGIKA